MHYLLTGCAFPPLTLHKHNCQSIDGFIGVLSEVDKLRPFFTKEAKHYSILNVDVSLYNSLSHFMYGLDAMQYARQNVFVLFGIWHAYAYGYVAIWDFFRTYFLADAWFLNTR